MDEEFAELPPELIAAITAQERAVTVIATRVDEEIEARSARHFGRSTGNWSTANWFTAAAAGLLVAVGVSVLMPAVEPTLYADYDQSGKVDIADVLLAARTDAATGSAIDTFARQVVALREQP